ncbi:MAG: DUF5765 domain-containing protein [Patescibacteria group bacterium]|nr:MAG: DUF5765 domain-containing protein [Patescibacteria group bacterium]
MCWSGEASFALAVGGFAGAYWSRHKGHETFRWLPLAYFSVMETLQGLTYAVIGECGLPANTALTYLSYIHICFQPFFVNMFALSWLPAERRKAARWVWPMCIVGSAFMLSMLTGQGHFGVCNVAKQALCGLDTCSYHGEWHIAWRLTLSNFDPNYLSYWITVFIVPIVYGSWRFVAYHFVLGPFLAWQLTGNKDERAAVWCLSSIAFLSAAHISFISRLLTIKAKPRDGTSSSDQSAPPSSAAH